MNNFQVSLLLALSVAILFIFGCKKEENTPIPPDNNTSVPWTYSTGKNSYQLEVDEATRNIQVFVPSTYNEATPTPCVFMFHGSGGSGQAVYLNSGWKELAEQEGFIVAFPTALEYFVVELNQTQTKWSADGLSTEVSAGTLIKDDILFIEQLLSQVELTFNIDPKRIYASGFSNGGGFVKSNIMTRMTERFAAFGTAGGHGLPIAYPANHQLALHTIMGNKDDKKLTLAEQTAPFPMDGNEIMSHDYLRGDIDNILIMLDLESIFSEDPVPPHFNTLSFNNSQSGATNEYRFRMVAEMGHIWPNGMNHASGLSAAALFWDFFQEYPKE